MDLYHADIRLPEGFIMPTARVSLCWTRHADSARKDDRYAEIPRFESIPLCRFEPVEVGVEAGIVKKIVCRGHWTTDLDVVFVLIPDWSIWQGPWTVKTVWVNERNDTHKTLDRSKYMA